MVLNTFFENLEETHVWRNGKNGVEVAGARDDKKISSLELAACDWIGKERARWVCESEAGQLRR